MQPADTVSLLFHELSFLVCLLMNYRPGVDTDVQPAYDPGSRRQADGRTL